MDTVDFKILKAISDLRVASPKADKINSLVRLDPEELGARLGVLEMEGYIEAVYGDEIPGVTLPNGMSAAKITNTGRRALSGNRWQ